MSRRVLPVAAVYGGNASGKTNLFEAFRFMRKFVVEGAKIGSEIGVDTYRLDRSIAEKPTQFILDFVVDENRYELEFSVTRKEVVSESLVQILPSSERTLYERNRNGFQRHDRPARGKEKEELEFERFVQKSTRPNQLFLTNAPDKNLSKYNAIYEWFRDGLVFIEPRACYGLTHRFWESTDPLGRDVGHLLSDFDTGIVQLEGKEVDIESLRLLPADLEKIRDDLQSGRMVALSGGMERYVLTMRDSEIIAQKLVSYHRGGDGQPVMFDLRQESDGTLRLMDLLPCFLDIADPKSKTIYFIDELDASMHTLLTRTLLDGYLTSCGEENRSQLIFTTHDLLLMDQDMFRRDEMWITDRRNDGSTELISLAEYKGLRKDKDVRRDYLVGRLKGIPKIVFSGPFVPRVTGE